MSFVAELRGGSQKLKIGEKLTPFKHWKSQGHQFAEINTNNKNKPPDPKKREEKKDITNTNK